MFATLDPEEQNSDNIQPEEVTSNDIIEKIAGNPSFQEEFNRLKESQAVNAEIAQEVLSILNEIENNVNDSAGGHKYLNFETEPIPYQILRRAGESEPARLIKNKRRLDFAIWGTPPATGGGIERGAKLVYSNPAYQPSKEEKIMLSEWETRLFNTIFFPPNETRANFGKFIGAAYEDFFDLDDMTFEVRQDGLGNPLAIHLQDPIIYKPIIKQRRYQESYGDDVKALLDSYESLYNEPLFTQHRPEDPDYLLVYQNHLHAAVTRDRVRKHHFFVRSDFRKTQRGLGIVEQAIRMITYITNAIKMNASNFTNSKLPQGFFAFLGGGVNQMQLEKLKKTLFAYQSGAGNQSRFPMLALRGIGNEKPDVKWVGTRNNSRDMEYHQFMTLLFSIFCQLSGTDPREVSLGDYGDTVGKKSLFDDPSDGIIKESRDSGAKTFLTHLTDSLNEGDRYGQNIFQRITKLDVKLKFVGFEVEDRVKKMEIQTKELATTKSINDLLAEQDVPKQELMLGDVNIYDMKAISNQQVFQSLMMKTQQAQQEQQMQAQQQMQPGQDPNQPQQGEGQDLNEITDKDKQLIEKYKGSAEMDEQLQQELQ